MRVSYGQSFSAFRALLAYQFALPGKKAIFMGLDFAPDREWSCMESLPWFLLGYDAHRQLQGFVCTLNQLYQASRPLYQMESAGGFARLEVSGGAAGAMAFLRSARPWGGRVKQMLCVFHFGEKPALVTICLPGPGMLRERLHTAHEKYGGPGALTEKELRVDGRSGGRIALWLPPLCSVYYDYERENG